ncbi:MAG: YraN family protein [Terracoccus sp.]
MDSTATRALGDYGERLAARFLVEQGLTLVERNWRCARGEIDIVALDGDCLVVCEVKTRSSEAYGAPFEAVTWRKARRLGHLAHLWRDAHPHEPRGRGGLRIDVVSVLRVGPGPAVVSHLRGVQ